MPRPSHATVVAYLALFVALGTGVAFAATKITSSKQIKAGVVNSGDLKNESITAKDLKAGSVQAQELAADAVTGDAVANQSLSAIDIQTSSFPFAKGESSFEPGTIGLQTGTIGIPGSPSGDIATLALPSGKWFVIAHAILSADDNGGGAFCLLRSPDGQVIETAASVSSANYSALDHTPEGVSISMITEVGSPFVVRLGCADDDTGVVANDRGIEAVRLIP